MKKWQNKHLDVMKRFLKLLNENTDEFILKGGTALLFCYNLDRFSEDLDFDSTNKNFFKYVKIFAEKNNFSYRISKDIETTKRAFLNYGANKPLKLEVSYRKNVIDKNTINLIKNINVYKINELAILKGLAYQGRDKIRDLYDLSFIIDKYFNELDNSTISIIRNAIGFKGIGQFDYLISTQADELIDKYKAESLFLSAFDKLDLLNEKENIK